MIEKNFEPKFLLKFAGSIIAGCAIIITALYWALPRKDVLHYSEAVFSFMKTGDVLVKTFIVAGIIELFFIIFAIAIISILASHKIAGPVYRLEKALEKLSDGDLTQKVYFRRYDPLKDVARTFNDTLKEFTQRLSAIDEANNEMNKAREELDGSAESIEKFKGKINALEQAIEKFKL